MSTVRHRMAIRELEKNENSESRFAFLKAFQKIKSLPPGNPDSYWAIASINAQPFNKIRTVPVGDSSKVWGGYSQHNNVLFLPWYRAYLLHLEEALIRNATSPSDSQLIALPFWDATDARTLEKGLPDLLMDDYVTIDANDNRIPNPLLGYTIPTAIPLSESNPKFSKPSGYTTRRYPFSSLMDPRNLDQPTKQANIQNDYIMNYFKSPKVYLQENVIYALSNKIKQTFVKSLDTGDYNPFSNIRSQESIGPQQTSLETASIELLQALGGDFDNTQLLGGALGDIGVKEMAAFDPLFFLHMANIDRVFWLWQHKWEHTDHFIITDKTEDKGIKPKDGQGPSPKQGGNETLTNTSELHPFNLPNSKTATRDVNSVIDIEKQLNYNYVGGSIGATR